MSLHVVRDAVCDQLFRNFQANLGFYRTGEEWRFDDEQILTAALAVDGEPPALVFPRAGADTAQEELTNAVRLYEWLGTMPAVQARDRRLWAFLAHTTYAPYTRARWPVPADLQTQKKLESARGHWFVTGGLAGARRHSIARLWWAAHLTEIVDAENDDERWALTRVLFLNQDIYQGLMERLYGTSRSFRLAVLRVLLEHEAEITSNSVTTYLKHLNYVAQWRLLPSLNSERLHHQLDELWARCSSLSATAM